MPLISVILSGIVISLEKSHYELASICRVYGPHGGLQIGTYSWLHFGKWWGHLGTLSEPYIAFISFFDIAMDMPMELTALNITPQGALLRWNPPLSSVDNYVFTLTCNQGRWIYCLLTATFLCYRGGACRAPWVCRVRPAGLDSCQVGSQRKVSHSYLEISSDIRLLVDAAFINMATNDGSSATSCQCALLTL